MTMPNLTLHEKIIYYLNYYKWKQVGVTSNKDVTFQSPINKDYDAFQLIIPIDIKAEEYINNINSVIETMCGIFCKSKEQLLNELLIKNFGTKEWAVKNINILNGCNRDCVYCYAKANAVRFGSTEPDNWHKPKLRHGWNKSVGLCKGIIMYPSTHDIDEEHIENHLSKIQQMVDSGNKLLIVTKPDFYCIEMINRKMFRTSDNHIEIRFTITSYINNTLSLWEPNASIFEERLMCLESIKKYGGLIKTSVSIEPFLDDTVEQVIEKCLPYVTEAIWIGPPTYLKQRLSINGHSDNRKIIMAANSIIEMINAGYMQELYDKYKNNPKIKFKNTAWKYIGKD